MTDILVVKDLVKYFPIKGGLTSRVVGQVQAVDGVSLSIPGGQTLGLVGESGCGKTTVGRCILRLIEPTSGEVWFAGQDVRSLKGAALRGLRRRMQIVFQDPYGSLNPRMSVRSMLEEPLRVHREPGAAAQGIRERAVELMEMVGIDPASADRYPHEFSGGQRQRVGIARALTLNPQFVICDEAVSALDVSIQAQILNLLMELQQKLSLTYLFIAHDLAVVKHISNRVAVMYLGEIVEEAATEELFARPVHPYTRALLASIPVPEYKEHKPRFRLRGEVPSAADPPPGCRFHPRCPIAIEECKATRPALVEIEPGHRVSCIRADVSVKMSDKEFLASPPPFAS